jgi:CRP-like cAMP-binding protein
VNRTVHLLISTARNGVVCMRYLQMYRMPLYRLLLANLEFLSQKLKEEGIEVLTDNNLRAMEDDVTRLYLMYHYGATFNFRATGDPSLYNFLYYRSRKRKISVNTYLELLGFRPIHEHDYLYLRDQQKMSFRDIADMTGIPKTTVHRKYKQLKGETG